MDYDLAIVGSGSVGAAAGYYAALAGLNVALFDRHSPPIVWGAIMAIPA